MPIITLPTPTTSDLAHLETCDSSVRLRRLIELAILRKLVQALVAAGYAISVDSGGEDYDLSNSRDTEAVMADVFAVDDCILHIIKGREHIGFVRLILDNGPDCISDYSVNLDDIIKPANDYAEQLQDWF